MRFVLDEMMPRDFAAILPDHDIHHMIDLGWRGTLNGKLLALCTDHGFDALITKDGNMPHQQNIGTAGIAVIVLRPRSQKVADLIEMALMLPNILYDILPGKVIVLEQQ